jgi:hypothetical protein
MKIPIFEKTGRKAAFKDPGAGQFGFSMITVGSSANNAITNCGGISSNSYVSQMTGYRISAAGEGDFRYLYADQMHVKVFVTDIERAMNGSEIISPSSSPVAADFTVPSAGASSPLVVQEFANFLGHVFAQGDIVRLRIMSRADNTSITVADVWGTVMYSSRNANANPTTQTYSFTRSAAPNAGTGSGTIPKGTVALDYGVSGNGYYEVTAVDGVNGANSPYAQTVTWTGHPATGCVVKARFGNLNGITDADFGGALTGYGFYGSNVYIKGKVVMTNQGSINISGFNNDAGFITGGDLGNKTYYSSTAPVSPRVGDFWFNTYVPGQYKMNRWNGTTWDIVSVYMDGSGVYAGNIIAGQVTAGTFTGFTFQTAASGKRVEMRSSDNELEFFEASGSKVRIGSNVSSSFPGITITDGVLFSSTTVDGLNAIYGVSTGYPNAYAGAFHATGSGNNYAVYGYAIGGTSNYSFYGAAGDVYNAGAGTFTGAVTGSNLAISNWNTAYGWGNHASAGYVTGTPWTSWAAPASHGASFGSHSGASLYVAGSSGGAVTTQVYIIPITINGVTYNLYSTP